MKTSPRHWFPLAAGIALVLGGTTDGQAQNYERYKPLDLPAVVDVSPDLPDATELPEQVEDDRVLVDCLDAVVIVDDKGKIRRDVSIDDLFGIEYDFDQPGSLVYKSGVQSIIHGYIGRPITLRRINEMSRDIIKYYRRCKQPIVDVIVPEQRITSGTLHIVVIESRIGNVKVCPGGQFSFDETSRWIESTHRGSRIYEPWIEDDLFWMNQSPFRQVGVDFEKGQQPGTTDVVYTSRELFPLRGYVGIDDSGVDTLNFGRFFAGFQYGNFLGRGGTLGYQYTTDEEFKLLEAHSVSLNQPLSRDYTATAFGSWAGVRPDVGFGLTQMGESYQHGAFLTRHLIRNRRQFRNLSAGYDFKATNNNLEFDQFRISNSTADLFQFRFGYDDLVRCDIDQFRLFTIGTFIGPGGGLTDHHSAEAFQTLRPGTSPDYIYGRMLYQRADVRRGWMLNSRFIGQASSERLLFSETLGLGGFDSIRGMDQRAYNADHGWIANFELGPKTYRWDYRCEPATFRGYGFVDMGNGYLDEPLPGENASTFAASTGLGFRFQLSDRLIARFDYGFGLKDLDERTRSDRAHFGLTWIPGRRL